MVGSVAVLARAARCAQGASAAQWPGPRAPWGRASKPPPLAACSRARAPLRRRGARRSVHAPCEQSRGPCACPMLKPMRPASDRYPIRQLSPNFHQINHPPPPRPRPRRGAAPASTRRGRLRITAAPRACARRRSGCARAAPGARARPGATPGPAHSGARRGERGGGRRAAEVRGERGGGAGDQYVFYQPRCELASRHWSRGRRLGSTLLGPVHAEASIRTLPNRPNMPSTVVYSQQAAL